MADEGALIFREASAFPGANPILMAWQTKIEAKTDGLGHIDSEDERYTSLFIAYFLTFAFFLWEREI